MHVAITGSSGLIGTALTKALTDGGHRVARVVRHQPSGPDEIGWDIGAGRLEPEALRGVDAVVHLAGEGIGERRWTPEQKRRIRDSRTEGTRLIAEAIAAAEDGPRVLVSVSGIHYYGDRGDAVLTEDSPHGTGFLPDVCVAWEAAADPAREAGVRVVHPRMGVVQSPDGGALRRLLPLFRLGLGGTFGRGRQYWSWITLDDAIGVLLHALLTDDLAGPVNATAPNPVTNAEFTRTLGRVLHRPAMLPVPPFGPAVLLGAELTQSALFDSIRALPQRTQSSGYLFRHPDLEAGLHAVLG